MSIMNTNFSISKDASAKGPARRRLKTGTTEPGERGLKPRWSAVDVQRAALVSDVFEKLNAILHSRAESREATQRALARDLLDEFEQMREDEEITASEFAAMQRLLYPYAFPDAYRVLAGSIVESVRGSLRVFTGGATR